MDGNHTGVLPSAYVLRALARSQVWGHTSKESIKAMQEKVVRARRGAAHLSSGDDAIHPSNNLHITLFVNR